RQAHNLKVAGSNPAPATNNQCLAKARPSGGFFAFEGPLLPRSDLARSKCFPNGFAARVHRKRGADPTLR
ncbi:hypothetical protein, partial [Porphyrobacter sp. CCH7-A1]|uniref:hypothetical protein n=1 Tax=Porphyrobacter sp. CCH7-A1 TaxID=1768773 RepID=UPI001E33633B